MVSFLVTQIRIGLCCSYSCFTLPLFMFRRLPSSLFVLSCSKLTQNWTHRGTKALLLLTNPPVSHLLFLFVWTRCIHINISGISWAADSLSPVTCCSALVCATAYDGVFVYVLSLNKAAGSGGRWEHVLWSYQGGSLSHKWRRCPPQVALMLFWSWQIFNINHFFFLSLFLSTPLPLALHLFPRCSRLGLQPLAYLWRRDQESLLSEMISSDLHAILIKVAAFGEFVSHSFVSQAADKKSDVPFTRDLTFFTYSRGTMLVKWCLAWGSKGQNLD